MLHRSESAEAQSDANYELVGSGTDSMSLVSSGNTATTTSLIEVDTNKSRTFTTTSHAGSAGVGASAGVRVQRGATYDVTDSNYVPKRRMEQHRAFLANEYTFPAKPRNMWEVSLGIGSYNISADVPNLGFWEKGGWAFDVGLRKAWGYTFSTRFNYLYGILKGLQWQQTENYRFNPTWSDNNKYVPAIMDNAGNVRPAEDLINYNFKSRTHQFNIDFMFNTNNIRFHRERTGWSFYGFVGIGGFLFNTRINTLDGNGLPYDFDAIIGNLSQVHGNRNEIRKRLQKGMDNSYETDAENERKQRRPGVLGSNSIDFSYSVGLGVAFRITDHFNIGIEHRITVPHEEDLLDGQRWAEQVYGNPVFTQNNDFTLYTSIKANFNLGISTRNVEPLYWLNPFDMYAKATAVADVLLPDQDVDGVTDQFDQCPGTPEGVPVDVNGCPMDTDGDGVPDYRDKQLITPTECQPVDEDGIGKCPCPDCMASGSPCTEIGTGTIVFPSDVITLQPAIRTQLDNLAAIMKANPECRVVIMGSGEGKKFGQISWERASAVVTYLTENRGLDRGRFILQYGQPGAPNTIHWRTAVPGEEGPSSAPPPFPNRRRN
jgi:outer membrane protein OmpA-like peptidoglycan-associated protein/opacity protein-like surface antigen